MTEDNRFVVGIGEVLWDKLYKDGKTSRKKRSLGGAPANFAYHVSRFGHEGLVVSAIGAGDAFTGAFIGTILQDGHVQDAHRIAVEYSAYVCTQDGAMPEMPAHFSKK